MLTTEILDHVRHFADKAHGDQVRKYTGERYIGHPVRVMEIVKRFHPQTEVLAAALLHDVLEDTQVTADQIEKSLRAVMDAEQARKTIDLVIDLTDIYIKKAYPRMNRRSRKEKEAARLGAARPEAQSIKYADIIDNVTDIVRQDTDFANVFVREAKKLLTSMQQGHPELRKEALALVDRCLQDLPKRAESV
jgi:(p)ppGpp synthase/HD superfamily hydrolase